MDAFEKIITKYNKKKYVKEQILIVHLGLGFEETHNPWLREIYEYSAVELLEYFVKVCIIHDKTKNLPKEAPMEHPRLPEFPSLGTLTGDVDEYYQEHAKNDNQIRLKAMGERENEELMKNWDGDEYMNKVNWSEKKLKKGYKIEMCFSYRDEVEDNRFM